MRENTSKQNLIPKMGRAHIDQIYDAGITARVTCGGNADSCISCPVEGLFARNGF